MDKLIYVLISSFGIWLGFHLESALISIWIVAHASFIYADKKLRDI